MSWLASVGAAGVLGVSACWIAGATSFWLDLIANFQAQIAIGVLITAVLMVMCRLRRQALILAIAVAVAVFPVIRGRSIILPKPAVRGDDLTGVVRVVTLNIHPENASWRSEVDAALAHEPDIVVLIETSYEMWRWLVRDQGMKSSELSYTAHRDWVDELASPCIILSRWPLDRLEFPLIPQSGRDVLLCEVAHPMTPFVVGAVHPHSPRSTKRWKLGNAQIRLTALALEDCRERGRGPVLLGSDINAGLAGSRAARLRQAGMSPTKPILGGWGSFPASFPGVARLQLDDVWSSEEWEVTSWSSSEPVASDHRMIVADFRIAPGR